MSQGDAQALVVEDDQSWQQLLTEVLRDMDLAVDVAEDAAAALSYLQEASYVLAVVDLSLGGDHRNQDGLQVLEAVRRFSGCAAILLSGYTTAELAASVLEQKLAAACLHKEAFRRAEFKGTAARSIAASGQPAADRP